MDTPAPAPEARSSPRGSLFSVLLLFLLSCGLIRGVLLAQSALALPDAVFILPALFFLFLPDLYARWVGRGVDPAVLLPEPLLPALWQAAKVVGLLIVLIYPGFVLGNHLWQTRLLPWTVEQLISWFPQAFPAGFHPVGAVFRWQLPSDLLNTALWHLLAVGYCEEYFYRGWMQTHLDELSPKKVRILGADLGAGFLWTAVLFTLGHSLVEAHWWQPFIFFPALVFGWLRARTGNILAGAMFHAFANVAMIVLDTFYGLRLP